MWYDCTSLDGERSSFSTLRPGGKNKESSYLPEGDLQQITMILLGTQRTWKSHRAVFKWLSKKQYQNYYSGQSQQERAAWWTNQNSLQLHAFAQSAETIAHTGCNWFWFSVLLVGWKNSSRFLRQSLSINQFQSRNYFQQSFENCSIMNCGVKLNADVIVAVRILVTKWENFTQNGIPIFHGLSPINL